MARRDKGLAGSQPDGWEPAKLAVQEFSGWVKNADTKVTVVAAAFGVSLSIAVQQIGPTMIPVVTVGGCIASIWFLLLAAFCVASTCTAVGIYMALVPRTRSGGPNRFSWPDHASGHVRGETLDQSLLASSADAWAQARLLASIGAEKFKWLRRTLISFGVYLALLALLMGSGALVEVAISP